MVEGRFARVLSEVEAGAGAGAGAGVGVGVGAGVGDGVGVEVAAAVAWYASPAGAVMDGLAETLMVPDPAVLGVKSKVAAVVPLGARVFGAKVPENPAAAGVRTTPDGQAAPVGVTVRVTALPTVLELADRDVVKAIAAAGVGLGAGVRFSTPVASTSARRASIFVLAAVATAKSLVEKAISLRSASLGGGVGRTVSEGQDCHACSLC